MSTIVVVKEPNPHPPMITALAERWRRAGHEVLVHQGTGREPPPGDVAVLHVDLTRVPDAYVGLVADYPVVVNGRILDIDRARYAGALTVVEDDDWEGPVIVKTRANYGGRPELHHRLRQAPDLRTGLTEELRHDDWEERRSIDPEAYPVFGHRREVPAGVWRNPRLTVQRFVPERQDGLNYLRYCIFFGEVGWARRIGSDQPVVKWSNVVTEHEPVPVPPELRALRERLGIDYGRIDFVRHGDETFVFDVNKTLGGGAASEQYADVMDRLAGGFVRAATGRQDVGSATGRPGVA